MTDMTKGVDALMLRNKSFTLRVLHQQPDGRYLVTATDPSGFYSSFTVGADGKRSNSDMSEFDVIAKEVTRYVNVYADGEAANQGGCKVHGYAYDTEAAADAFATHEKRLGGKAVKITVPMA